MRSTGSNAIRTLKITTFAHDQDMTIKEAVERIIHDLPPEASLEDITYHLYVFEKLQQAHESEQRHGLIEHEVAKERIRRCLGQ